MCRFVEDSMQHTATSVNKTTNSSGDKLDIEPCVVQRRQMPPWKTFSGRNI